MNKQEFMKKASKKEFNTNNAWGFGGSSGYDFVIGTISIRKGERDYRHARSEPFERYFKDGNEITLIEFEQEIKGL